MPIKYLLVTSIRENLSNMKTRSFQNLIGRTARSGMYSEGTIIVTDYKYYDDRKNYEKGGCYRWQDIISKFDKNNSENCISTLIGLVKNFKISYNLEVSNHEIMLPVLMAYDRNLEFKAICSLLIEKYGNKYAPHFNSLVNEIERILISLENFLMYCFLENEQVENDKLILDICSETFAYSIANEEEKKH